jgi:rare lipoprotein A
MNILKFVLAIGIILTFTQLVKADGAINNHCYKFEGVLSCGTEIKEQKEVTKIEQLKEEKEDDAPIVSTSWEQGEEEGQASFYTIKSSGTVTASGETYDENGMTCASMDYPFNTVLKVTNIENGKFVLVKVNDRGNFKKYKRILDLSAGAFKKIADLKLGVITVKVEVVK